MKQQQLPAIKKKLVKKPNILHVTFLNPASGEENLLSASYSSPSLEMPAV